MSSLKGKVALITGVSHKTGIGYGIAKRLASMKAGLFLHSYAPYDLMMKQKLAENEADLILNSLMKYGGAIKQMEADLSNPKAPAKLFRAAKVNLGHIDHLILNHTHDTLAKLKNLTTDEIDLHLAVNIRASLLLIQEFVRQYDGRRGGRIIMLTSGQHLGPMTDLAYVASKGALHQMTSSVSDLLINKGITVNTVNPGPTKTYAVNEQLDKEVRERMPLGRWGEPDDAARLIAWLVSDDAQWITGQVINSEGGFRRG